MAGRADKETEREANKIREKSGSNPRYSYRERNDYLTGN